MNDPYNPPIKALAGISTYTASLLERLGLSTATDLLLHLPLRYQDRTRVLSIGTLRPGMEAVVEGVVDAVEFTRGRRRMLLAALRDAEGTLTLRFFHVTSGHLTALRPGTRLRCFGSVKAGQHGLEIAHPEFRRISADTPADKSLTPIYPATEGLTQSVLRFLTDKALTWAEENASTEWLPEKVLDRYKFTQWLPTLRYLHRPPPGVASALLESGRHPAQRRLAFEELLAHHLSLRRLRERRRGEQAPILRVPSALAQRLLERLPFTLTGAQRQVLDEITRDLGTAVPMLRLLQGDVGCGKTIVAVLAALSAVEAGYQVALMAPTELLAEQHYHNLMAWLQPLAIDVAWLTSSHKGKTRAQMLDRIAQGLCPMVVGTHALFQEQVRFHKLALVIIDEQHRFGVHQRLALRDKGATTDSVPHLLIMTATPIPRTLAMAVYADLDSSVIDELPPHRLPVQTVVIPDTRRDEVVSRVRAACSSGRQVYWVCTLIDESETLAAQAAAVLATVIAAALPELAVGLVHGRLKEKEAVMAQFKQGKIHVLVATTVIEVGVDIANADLMVIENAERLGLAQLHQLRGRVGRGATQSTCVLMYHGRLSAAARARLNVLRECDDGFAIARADLELRGPGEVLGKRQTGLVDLRIADLARDADLLPAVQKTAELLLKDYPDRIAPLIRRWLGEGLRYGKV